jgi:hypothetical protein
VIDPPPEIALVCGSRSLVGDTAAEAWARHLVECISDHAETLVTGDAPGPDSWAQDRVQRVAHANLRGRIYDLRGYVLDAWGTPLGRWAADAPKGPADPRWRRWPLERNAAMVRAVALRARRGGRRGVVYALVDPRSRTQGTMHTVTLARSVGLVAYVERWEPEAWACERRT